MMVTRIGKKGTIKVVRYLHVSEEESRNSQDVKNTKKKNKRLKGLTSTD